MPNSFLIFLALQPLFLDQWLHEVHQYISFPSHTDRKTVISTISCLAPLPFYTSSFLPKKVFMSSSHRCPEAK